MAIILFDKNCIVPYVPALNDNRKEKTPVIVGIKPFLNEHFLDFVSAIEAIKEEYPGDAKERGFALKSLNKQRFVDHVKWVKNCQKYMNDGSLVEMTNPGELFDNQTALASEIETAMQVMSVLTEGQAKNFEGASGGTSTPGESTGSLSSVENVPSEKEKTETVETSKTED